MRAHLLGGLSALALAALPLAAGTLALTLAGADAAYAGNGNGNGGGNGHGNGGGNGGGNGHGRGHQSDDDGDDDAGNGHGNGHGNGNGAIASELKGLNACHASDNARAHAAAGSQVGRIAAYETEQAEAAQADAVADQAQADYETLRDNPPRDAATIQADIDAIDADGDGVADEVDPDGDGTFEPGDQGALDELLAEQEAESTYDQRLADAEQAAIDAAEDAATAGAEADAALLEASNGREISEEAQAALDACLAD